MRQAGVSARQAMVLALLALVAAFGVIAIPATAGGPRQNVQTLPPVQIAPLPARPRTSITVPPRQLQLRPRTVPPPRQPPRAAPPPASVARPPLLRRWTQPVAVRVMPPAEVQADTGAQSGAPDSAEFYQRWAALCAEYDELISMLRETGLIYEFLQSQGAQASAVGYSDRLADDVLLELCALLGSLKPSGLGGLAGKGQFPRLPRGADCAFALLMQGMTGAGGGMGARIMQCLQKHRLAVGGLEPTQVRLPETNCGQARYSRTKYLQRLSEIDTDPWNKSKKDFYSDDDLIWGDWAGGELAYEIGGDGTTTSFEFGSSGELISIAETTEHGDGSKTEVKETKWGTTFIKHTDSNGRQTTITVTHGQSVTYYRDEDGNWIREEKDEEGNVTKEIVTDEGGGSTRPSEPGEGGCGESPAMQRARAIFDCIFSQTEAPDPGTIRPEGPPGPGLPAVCNETSMAAIWGSATGPSVTDPTNPEDMIRGGPNIFQSFVPKLHGAIDPPQGGSAESPAPSR